MTTPTLAPALPAAAPGAAAAADPLASLRDIHLPGPVPFWPPAPGWWMLAGLIVLVALVAVALEWRRRRTLGYRALQELAAIEKDRGRYADSRAVAEAAAVLVRRIVLTRGDATRAAAMSGENWLAFLGSGKAGLPSEIGRHLAAAPYAPPTADLGIDRDTLIAAVRRWIRGNA